MPRRPARLLRVRPSGRKLSSIEEPDEERVKGAGFQAGFARQIVSMTPLVRLPQQTLQHELSWLRRSRLWLHEITLHM